MSTYELNIDGSGAQEGSQRIVKSFDDIKAAASRMEVSVSASARKASESFAKLQQNVKPISNQAIDTLRQLSKVFSTFKAPSDAAVRNTIIFLQGLKSVGSLNIGRVTGLAQLLAAISGYKGPGGMAGKNTLALLNALRFASSYSNPRGLAATLNALSAFKGPTAAGARNTAALLNSLSKFVAPKGLAATATALDKISRAAATAAGHIRTLSTTAVKAGNIKINVNSRQAQGAMAGLIQQQGFLQTALLRTQTAWNALGGVLAGRAIIGASNDLIKIRAQLEAATGSAAQANVQFTFLQWMANRLGLDFRSTAQSFGFFLGSVKGTNLTLKESRDIFTGFSTAARALQLSTSDVDGVFRALGQMMSKGKIQAEELRQQLGDRLPGAYARFAAALHMTRPGELDQALKQGTVSGEKMKKAIIDVANSLNNEFATSADKMSKTVDAAFNRMRNAFVFAAGDLGKSGLNQAMINLMDTATKLLTSDAFNGAMRALGSIFKLIGDNINTFVTIMGTIALANTLKWVAGLLNLQKVLVGIQQLQAASSVGNFAAALGGATVQTTRLTRAMGLLNAVMRANPFLIIATALTGLMLLYDQLSESNEEIADKMSKNTDTMTDGTAIVAAYSQRIDQNSKALYDEAAAFERATLAALGHDRYLMSRTNFKVEDRMFLNSSWKPGGQGIVRRPTINGQEIDSRLAQVVRGVTDTSGNYVPARNESEYSYRIRMAEKLQRLGVPGSEDLVGLMTRDVGNAQKIGTMPGGRLGYSPENVLKALGIGNWESASGGTGVISGDPLAKTGRHGKSATEKWADELASKLTNAREAIEDIGIQAQNTLEEIQALLDGSLDAAQVAAQGAAREQLKTFEDAFKGPQKQAATMALAKDLGVGAEAQSYEEAKAAVLKYYEAKNLLLEQRKEIAKAAGDVRKLREENDAMDASMNIMQDLERSMYDVNKAREIEQMLMGVSIDATMPAMVDGVIKEVNAREELARVYGIQIDRRRQLTAEEELAKEQRDFNMQKRINDQMAPYQKLGAKQEDLDYYRELIELQEKLHDEGKNQQEIQDRVNVKAATLNQARAQKILNDEIEKGRQLAQDMADAIVGAFRDATSGGEDFLKSFKNMFKQLKDIILDFVLYNPLKQFLASAFGQVMGGVAQTGSPQTGSVTSVSPGAGGAIATAGSNIVAFAGSVLSSMAAGGASAGGGIGPGGNWNYDSERYLVPTNRDNAIVVQARRSGAIPTAALPPPTQQSVNDYWKNLTKIFDSEGNQKALTDLGTALKTGKGIGGAIGPAMQAVGSAVAAYTMGNAIGKGVGSALGFGERGQNVMGGVLGGAAAGFSIGGPIGAAVGAVAGGILGFLKKKTKLASSFGSVVVMDNGVAVVGKTGKYGKGTTAIGNQAATAGASIFNEFARNFDAILNPGKYGTFGTRQFEKKGESIPFYSVLGTSSKGKPLGKEGVDWIKGTESQVQAFALIQQVRRGMITGLSDTIKTIFQNTKASDMEGLQRDLEVGKAYDEFIRGSFKLNDVQRQVQQLNVAWKQLSRQARELGLDETKLARARARMMQQMKDEFNFSISQQILEISNPAQAAFNALVADYKDAVASAMAVGGDLTQVEKLYGMKRAELAKQWADMATNGLVSAAKDLLTQLKSSSSSPLNVSTVFKNAQKDYQGLVAQINKGDYSNVDKLATYTQNYLDAAQGMYGSSTQYFDIFDQVTKFLETVSGVTGGVPGGSGVGSAPALPKLDAIVAEINAQSLEMADELGLVGMAVMEGSNAIVAAINNLSIALGYNPTSPTPAPTTPTPQTGGTGSGYPTSSSGGSGGGYSGGGGTGVGGRLLMNAV